MIKAQLRFQALAFFIILSFATRASDAQFSKEKGPEIPLPKALKDVSRIFDTKFVYEKTLVEGKTTSYPTDEMKGKKVEDVLKSILYPNNLVFLYIKQNYYTIVSKDRLEENMNNIIAAKSNDSQLQRPNTHSPQELKLNIAENAIKDHPVKGIVRNSAGEPLQGVSVIVEGSNSGAPSPVSYPEYIKNKAKPQMRELLTKFPDLVEIWYDYPRYMNPQQSFEFYKLAYDIQPKALINSRVGNGFGDYLSAGDNQIPTDINTKYKIWETPGTLNNTWGYKSYDHDWKSFNEMLFWVVEIASKGGNYLLNVGPDGNGVIPEESAKVLREIGAWLKINGEAIYGTSRWTTMKEGPTTLNMKSTVDRRARGFNTVATPEDFWFTKKDNNVYVISLVPPTNNIGSVKSLYNYRSQIKSISVLGRKGKLTWKVHNDKIDIAIPWDGKNNNATGFVLKVELK